MSSLKDLFDKKHLPEEVLQQILIYLKDIAPSLFLRLSHDLCDKYVSSVYRSVRLSGENVESFLYGAMKTPGLGHIEETYEGCGVHKHEINIDWYSDKTHALSLVRKLEFTDVESMKKFSQIVGDKIEFSYGLSSGEKEVLCSKNVEYIPLDYSHIIEKEATNVVEMFKCSIGGIIDRAKRKNHSGPVKLQCFVPSRYTIGLRSLVDHKMKEAVGKVEPDRGHWSVNGDEYVRRWQEYVEIMDLEGSDVCESCGRH
ncbi:hypothetical protein I204_08295 [Kwoniella mangroviensis CBS 8886]|nr:hypothetical protein I204_08295 [Kwoniella mangroviensis CBS 8886]